MVAPPPHTPPRVVYLKLLLDTAVSVGGGVSGQSSAQGGGQLRGLSQLVQAKLSPKEHTAATLVPGVLWCVICFCMCYVLYVICFVCRYTDMVLFVKL